MSPARARDQNYATTLAQRESAITEFAEFLQKDCGINDAGARNEYAELHIDEFEKTATGWMHVESATTAERYVNTELRSKRPHLWDARIDRTLAYKAFAEPQVDGRRGNVTAQGQLHREVGAERYTELAKLYKDNDNPPEHAANVAATRGEIAVLEKQLARLKASLPPEQNKLVEVSTNPFTKSGWNVSKQGSVFKTNPELCARLARAAGVAIGATKPVK
jgi:hypothetical protein